ncbi:MAG: GNAT family N-acetyltransferase [Lachnospiraceae bacterium]|nr:GNAT family N-acetyltransferase [Lachnospiraceae bacterium]
MVREAGKTDLSIVREITQTTIRSIYPRYYPAGAVEFFSKYHSDENIMADLLAGKVYILYADEVPVGTVTISENHINRLFVLPEHQHKGYGKVLLDLAEKKVFENYDHAEIDASFPAKKMYIKRGYKEIEYGIITTDNGDHLCFDIMRLER